MNRQANENGSAPAKVGSSLFMLAAAVSLLTWGPVSAAQDGVYRCPNNEYTNNPTPAQKKECKLLEGLGVTVVPAMRVSKPPSAPAASGGTPAAPAPARATNEQQKARDSDARAILESELKKAESRLAELLKEYNNGQPERKAEEIRNVAKYQERVADLKAGVTRAEADVQGLRREIQRLPGGAASN